MLLSILTASPFPMRRTHRPDKPSNIAAATGKLNTLALRALLNHFDWGGAKWIQQFNFSSPLVGEVSQGDVYKADPAIGGHPAFNGIWPDAQERFTAIAKASWALRATELWGESLQQNEACLLDGPNPFSRTGAYLAQLHTSPSSPSDSAYNNQIASEHTLT